MLKLGGASIVIHNKYSTPDAIAHRCNFIFISRQNMNIRPQVVKFRKRFKRLRANDESQVISAKEEGFG
jgi:hypothetical protein